MDESEVLTSIANRVREWKGKWENVWDNINLRTKILQTIADIGVKKPDVMEASFMIASNSMFHILCEDSIKEFGELDSKEIFNRWTNWMKTRVV